MKKFKVIEPSRFLDNEAMQQTKGGISCTGGETYTDCSLLGSYVICRPSAAGGYIERFEDGSKHISCGGADYTYNFCLPGIGYTTICSGNTVYNG